MLLHLWDQNLLLVQSVSFFVMLCLLCSVQQADYHCHCLQHLTKLTAHCYCCQQSPLPAVAAWHVCAQRLHALTVVQALMPHTSGAQLLWLPPSVAVQLAEEQLHRLPSVGPVKNRAALLQICNQGNDNAEDTSVILYQGKQCDLYAEVQANLELC